MSGGSNVEKFRSHANYLRALAHSSGFGILPQEKATLRRGMAQLAASRALKIRVDGKPNTNGVKASLASAWGSEMLLAMNGKFAASADLLALSNNWAAVQAYYVGYHAFQAMLQARGRDRPEAHGATQRMFADFWVDQVRDMPALSYAFGSTGAINFPRAVDAKRHPWSACDDHSCLDIAAVAMRTTRADAVVEKLDRERVAKSKSRRKKWREEEAARLEQGKRARTEPAVPEKSNLTPSEKAKHDGSVRAHTMLDYLYRLRVRANYEDSEMFTEGPESDSDSYSVHRDLTRIASFMALAHEEVVAFTLGEEWLDRQAASWISTNVPDGLDYGIVVRQALRA